MQRAIVVAAVFALTPVAAGPALSSDRFSGFADLQLRVSLDKIKTFSKQWLQVHDADRDDNVTQYALKGTAPSFEGVKVDKAVASVSRHLHVIVGIGLSFSGGSCSQLTKTLQRVWGTPFDVGGRDHELEWKGERVDASVTDDGPTGCMLFVGDVNYDDEKDDWKKRR